MIGECLDQAVTGRSWENLLARYRKQYGKLFKEEQEMYGTLLEDVDRIVRNYMGVWGKQGGFKGYICDDKTGNPYEVELNLVLPSGIPFVGFIDKMPVDKEKRVWVLDHKSHKNIPDEEARFGDLQTLLYMWAAPLCGYPKPVGVVWDYLRTKPPSVPEVLKSGEMSRRENIDTTWDVYSEALVEAGLDPDSYADMQEKLKGREAKFFQRVFLPHPSDTMVKAMVEDVDNTAREIQKNMDDGTRTMNKDCSWCQFYLLCHAETRGLDAAFIRKAHYETKEGEYDGHEKNVPEEE